MKYLFSIALSLLISACTSNGVRIEQLARASEMQRSEIEVDGLRSIIFTRNVASGTRLTVFLEGDGQPWLNGVVPAADPTTRDPLALKLLLRTSGMTAYVSRPCYQDERTPRCSPELWTQGRYSPTVIEVMRAAIEQTANAAQASEIVLVGYSGGGVLAVLLAERLERIKAVVTIAANLDIHAWTQHHQYLSLAQSLNPALSERAHAWNEIHLVGMRDVVVPPATSARYFERFPKAQRWELEQHGHVCCWLEEWSALWEKISAAIDY
jgi:predicted alpha/beta hydrolase family esterase